MSPFLRVTPYHTIYSQKRLTNPPLNFSTRYTFFVLPPTNFFIPKKALPPARSKLAKPCPCVTFYVRRWGVFHTEDYEVGNVVVRFIIRWWNLGGEGVDKLHAFSIVGVEGQKS